MKLLAFILLALAVAWPRSAQAIEESSVIRGSVRPDPTIGYIFLKGKGRKTGFFLRLPEDAELIAYEAERRAAYDRALRRAQRDLEYWTANERQGRRPVLPDEATFTIDPIEMREAVSFGPQYVYSKDDAIDDFSYFMPAKPGTYIWYGPIASDPSLGWLGYCNCLGTVQFEVRPGVVTNLGNFLSAAPLWSEDLSVPNDDLKIAGAYVVRQSKAGGFQTMAVDYQLPPSLSAWPSVIADFHAYGKSDNHFGIMARRLPPIPGVLAYDRDRPVDLKARDQVQGSNTP